MTEFDFALFFVFFFLVWCGAAWALLALVKYLDRRSTRRRRALRHAR